ncbi:hypothetical protein [Chitiniphilus shinanonensis]|uniref:hypothetical protein n=1 Tax=Chitiniphilus shinanonensis TaxID=553088 RepID=UPI00305ACB06
MNDAPITLTLAYTEEAKSQHAAEALPTELQWDFDAIPGAGDYIQVGHVLFTVAGRAFFPRTDFAAKRIKLLLDAGADGDSLTR